MNRYKPCGVCGRLVSITDISEDKAYFTVKGVNMPLCSIHRPIVHDSLIYQTYKRIASLNVGDCVALNCDDEFFIINNDRQNVDFDDSFVSRFNNWSISNKKDTRVKKYKALYIGYVRGDLCRAN